VYKLESMKKPASGAIASGKRLTQRQLESAILRQCAAGRDRLDRRMAKGVKIISVRPSSEGFPRKWFRREGRRMTMRGSAEWYIPPKADGTRRMLFLHGGSYVVYAPQDAVYRSLASRLASRCGVPTCISVLICHFSSTNQPSS